MTCGVPFPLLEASPLYENEDLKEGSIPTVTSIEQVRDEGNCGEVTNHEEQGGATDGTLSQPRRPPLPKYHPLIPKKSRTYQYRRTHTQLVNREIANSDELDVAVV